MPATSPSPALATSSQRLDALDAYRGLTMLLLALTVPNYGWQERIAEAHPDSPMLARAMEQFEHVEWAGFTLWDMIQPSFMFMVGAALAYSFASRRRRGDSYGAMFAHAAWRAVVLSLLGVFLRSLDRSSTYWTLEDVTTQIGLGYVPLFLLAGRPRRVQAAAVAAIFVGYWLLFSLWPAPPASYDDAALEGQAYFTGFFAHWNRNAHPAHYFDQWLLNLFPREQPFVANEGGYNTLNFVPALATMIIGLMAGELLRSDAPKRRACLVLAAWGAAAVAAGWLADALGICPIVKKIWTPAFGLLATGLCLIVLAALVAVIDLAGYRRWAWPAIVVGKNSLAMYCLTWLASSWVLANLQTHLGTAPFRVVGDAYQPLMQNLATGACLWLICYWMDRRQLFLRV